MSVVRIISITVLSDTYVNSFHSQHYRNFLQPGCLNFSTATKCISVRFLPQNQSQDRRHFHRLVLYYHSRDSLLVFVTQIIVFPIFLPKLSPALPSVVVIETSRATSNIKALSLH